MSGIVILKAEDLNLKPTVDFGPEVENCGFDHAQLLEAFKTAGLRPVTDAQALISAIINLGFEGYVPDEDFFRQDKPDCPCYEEMEGFVRDRYLSRHGGWPPEVRWLLEK